MSNNGDSGEHADRAALKKLETVVGQALERLTALQSRAESAEAKAAEFEELLKRFSADGGAADRLLTRLKSLEEENEDLRERLGRGREGVDRVLARIRFLEEQR